MKWVSTKDSEDEKKVASELTYGQGEWRKARAAVSGAINNRETSPLYIRLTGSTRTYTEVMLITTHDINLSPR